MVVAGTLVGSSGTLLTLLMCKAMNRPVTNVLFGAFGSSGGSAAAAGGVAGTVKPIQADEVALLLAYAQRVVVVPGYGMAVAQAQHSVRELSDELGKRGVEVQFAIHPVAGRMPGHMNVLLAEANVPYDQLIEMEADQSLDGPRGRLPRHRRERRGESRRARGKDPARFTACPSSRPTTARPSS